jgi:hypothetical protein
MIGSKLCQVTHVGMTVSGPAAVKIEDGTELVLRASAFFNIPVVHDSWVVNVEEYVSLHPLGADAYDKSPGPVL